MPSDAFELRVSFRKLLIGMLVTITPISLFGLWAVSRTSRSMEAVIGNHFTTIAQSAAAEVSHLVHQYVEQAAMIAAEASVEDAVTAANQSYAGAGEAAVNERIQAIEKTWNSPAGEARVNAMLASRASRQLRRFRERNPKFLRITVTDEKGATVAATHKTLDYFQADEEFWQNIYAQGRGAISLTDILYDEITKANYVGVGIPILDPASGKFLGAVDALMDISIVFPVVGRFRAGSTGRMMLVREDGAIIGSPDISLAMRSKSEEFQALQDAVKDLSMRRSGFVLTNLARGRYVIAFADTGLKQDYRGLGSVILVVQEAKEAFAPVSIVERLTAAMGLLGLALVTLLAVYFSMHRKVSYTDIQPPPARAAVV